MPLDCYRLYQQEETLRFTGLDGELIGERALIGVAGLVQAFQSSYQGIVSLSLQKHLGGVLYDWLDGEQRWLRRVGDQNRPFTLLIDLVLGLRQLPWELCHDGEQFLVSSVSAPFNPVRCLSSRSAASYRPVNRPLRILFSACSPDHVPSLDFQLEQAALRATTRGRVLELVVDETGSLGGLVRLLKRDGYPHFDILHLSGHADITDQGPIFHMEGWQGQAHAVSPEELARALRPFWPRLLFLSGCQTGQAAGGGSLPSFCESMVAAGAPMVLGWSLPVGDTAASLAGAELYGRLTTGEALDVALVQTRNKLRERQPLHWHMLRCYAEAHAFAAIVTPPKAHERVLVKRRPVRDLFIDAGAPLAEDPSSCLDRRTLQRGIEHLIASPDRPDFFCQGLQLVGTCESRNRGAAIKLCMAMNGWQPLVWVGKLVEASFLDMLKRELGPAHSGAIPSLSAYLETFESATKNLLFVFDQFQENGSCEAQGLPALDARGQMQVLPEAQSVLRNLMEWIVQSGSASRVLVTSRYRVAPLSAFTHLHCEVVRAKS